MQGTRFATVAEMEAQIEDAARLERPEWPARQRAKLQFARCFWFARQGRIEEALACAQRQVAICRDDGVEVAALYATSNVTFMESLLGRPREALEHARTAIARLHALDADAGAGHLYFSEMIALLMLNRTDEALVAARNAYPRLSHEGDHHRLLLPLALLNALSRTARRGCARRGVRRRHPGAQWREREHRRATAPYARLDPLLAAGLSVDERARLAAEGAALRDEDAFKLALIDAA